MDFLLAICQKYAYNKHRIVSEEDRGPFLAYLDLTFIL